MSLLHAISYHQSMRNTFLHSWYYYPNSTSILFIYHEIASIIPKKKKLKSLQLYNEMLCFKHILVVIILQHFYLVHCPAEWRNTICLLRVRFGGFHPKITARIRAICWASYTKLHSANSLGARLLTWKKYSPQVIFWYSYCDHFKSLCEIPELRQNYHFCRDIKGANILVGPNGEIKLADFGMAKPVCISYLICKYIFR